MKSYEQYKRILRFIFNTVLVGTEMALYWYIWLNYYNGKMDVPYNRTGHWLMVAVYGLLLILFSRLFGGLKVGYLKTANIIYSQFFANLFANGMIYLQITLLTKHFQTVLPLLVMTITELILTVLWSWLSNRIYRMVYPPRRVLLIYRDHPSASLMGKLHTRMDCFIVEEAVNITMGLETIKSRIDEYEGVVLCDVPSQLRNQLLKYCYGKSLRVYATPKISDIIIRSAESLHMFDTPLVLCRNSGLSFEQRLVKRILDIVLSLTALIVLSPVFMITAAAIWLYDKGPVFFYQDRCTKDGKVFSICKFRSMIVDAEKDGHSIPATEKDPRITPVGNIIRKTRIDELPQIINILKGDMSIVGPRPERIEHVELYSKEIPEFHYRLKVKGGLTGYAQVYGKYNTTAYDKLKLDLMYIQNYSMFMDIAIIFKTIKVLFMKESTEGFLMEDSLAITKEEIFNTEQASEYKNIKQVGKK